MRLYTRDRNWARLDEVDFAHYGTLWEFEMVLLGIFEKIPIYMGRCAAMRLSWCGSVLMSLQRDKSRC